MVVKSKLAINCEFALSKFCKKTYTITKSAYLANLERNGGVYRCKYCAIEATHGGENSHYFKYHKNDHFFSEIDSNEKAYLLGVIAGDGFVGENAVVLVANSKDKETLDRFADAVFIDDRPLFYKNGNCLSVSVSSKQLIKDLCYHLRISPGKKSDKITLPNLNSDDLKWAFIRGLFDTDGSVSNIYKKQKSPTAYCSSTSKLILEQIRDYCSIFNITGRITGIRIKFNGKQAMQFMQRLYDNNFSALTRKKEMYKLWLTWAPRQGNIAWTKKPVSLNGIKAMNIINRKFLSDQIVEIFRLARSGLLQKDIAKIYGVHPRTICSILNRRVYKEVTIDDK